MTQEEKHAVALMRYAAITPLINGTKDEYQSLSSFFKEAALKPYPAADGSMRQFSPAAIERWYRFKSGFDALLPKDRSDSGKSRALDDNCQEYIRHMKTRYPRLPAAAIYRQMLQGRPNHKEYSLCLKYLTSTMEAPIKINRWNCLPQGSALQLTTAGRTRRRQ